MRSEAFWLAFGRAGNVVLSLVSLRAMTALLMPAEFAICAIFTVFQAFAGLILINPVGHYLYRHLHEWRDDGSLPARLHALSWYWLSAAGLSGLLASAWFLSQGQLDGSAVPIAYGLGVGFAVYALTQQGVATNTLNMLGFRRQSVLWQIAGTGMGLLLSLLLTTLYPSALSWVVGQGIGAWLAYVGIGKLLPCHARTGYLSRKTSLKAIVSEKDFKSMCYPLAIVTGLFWLEGNGYRLILERGWQPDVFAFFLLALSLPAQIGAVFESFVMQFVYPYFFRAVAGNADAEKKRLAVGSMVNALWPTYVVWVALIWIAAPYALTIITDPTYHDAAQWLWVGTLAEFARLTGNVWQIGAQAEKNFTPMRKPFAVGAAGTLLAAGCAAWLQLPPVAYGVLMVLALMAKAIMIIRIAYVRMPFQVAYRRMALAASVFALAVGAAKSLPPAENVLGATLYIALASICAAIPLGLHFRTSPAFKYLFSYSLRNVP